VSLIFSLYIRTLAHLLSCSSRGSLLNSPGHMFVFAITTVIFILATTVLYFGPGLTTQGIPFIIRVIDPSITVGWSPHKLNVVVGVIAVISRLNVRIRLFITWFQCSGITRKPHHSLSSATSFVRGVPWYFGNMIGE
jgi:hypothetical protein